MRFPRFQRASWRALALFRTTPAPRFRATARISKIRVWRPELQNEQFEYGVCSRQPDDLHFESERPLVWWRQYRRGWRFRSPFNSSPMDFGKLTKTLLTLRASRASPVVKEGASLQGRLGGFSASLQGKLDRFSAAGLQWAFQQLAFRPLYKQFRAAFLACCACARSVFFF